MSPRGRDLPGWARRGRGQWQHVGGGRPSFAREPAAGQESVWDYPRPPALVRDERLVVVEIDGREVARTREALRVLETASPPTFYLPAADVCSDWLAPGGGESRCEWKGVARYWDFTGGPDTRSAVAWSYPEPFSDYAALAGCFAFYPARADCRVDGELVRPQGGGFYGGWVTDEIVGPWKGEAGTSGW